MSDRTLLTFFNHLKNLEWQMIDDMLEENFKYELHWSGMTFDKNDFLSLVKVTAEEVQPWSTNFEIVSEVQFGNVTVIQLVKPMPNEEPPIFELMISEWVGPKVKRISVYNCPKIDTEVSNEWVESLRKDSE